MMGIEFAVDWKLWGAVMFGLFMFGLIFNGLVEWLGERKEGYVSLMVVGGVLVTLGGIAFISWPAAILGLAAFVASGLPMVIGEIVRTIKKRETALHIQRMIAEERFKEYERD
jgi:hypothetical protein